MLNRQKGQMYPWVTATKNPIRGKCPHDCVYCVPAGTKILMANFSLKPIEEIKSGEFIVGLKADPNKSNYSHYEKSKVIATASRNARTLKIDSDEGSIECTEEHKLLGGVDSRNYRDWRPARNFSPYQSIRYVGKPIPENNYYLKGWLAGFIDGDGCFFKTYNKKHTIEYVGFELVSIDAFLREFLIKTAKRFRIILRENIKHTTQNSHSNAKKYIMVTTRQDAQAKRLKKLIEFSEQPNFLRGYIGGMIDAEGTISGRQGYIRIFQNKGEVLNKIKKALDVLNFSYVVEKNGVRLVGGIKTKLRILFECQPKYKKKAENLLYGRSLKNTPVSIISSIEAMGNKRVYNIETETENYIANGFIVHNCYIKTSRVKKLYQGKPYLVESFFNKGLGKNKIIFIGSCFDLFANGIPDNWIQAILLYCRVKYPTNTYLFQSKNTQNMYGYEPYFPPKVIVGTTAETNRNTDNISKAPSTYYRLSWLNQFIGYKKMISIEPIMDFDLDVFLWKIINVNPSFVSIGADSKGHNLPEPPAGKIKELIQELEKFTTVKLKDNLERLLRI